MPALVDRFAQVSRHRLVDFDYLAPPGRETDVHRAWKALHDIAVPDIVFTPHYGRPLDRNAGRRHRGDAVRRGALFDGGRHDPEGGEDLPCRAARDGPSRTHAISRAALAEVWAEAGALLEGSVRALAGELIDAFVDQGECELVERFAKRLPIDVFLRLVDLPLEDRQTPLEMTEASVRGDEPLTSSGQVNGMMSLPLVWPVRGRREALLAQGISAASKTMARPSRARPYLRPSSSARLKGCINAMRL